MFCTSCVKVSSERVLSLTDGNLKNLPLGDGLSLNVCKPPVLGPLSKMGEQSPETSTETALVLTESLSPPSEKVDPTSSAE